MYFLIAAGVINQSCSQLWNLLLPVLFCYDAVILVCERDLVGGYPRFCVLL